jgi:hypothetical protein
MESYALLLAATLNAGTVLAIAALGLLINEKAGIVNLGAEGMMLCAAVAGFATVVHTGNDWLGFAAGMGAGALLAAMFGLLVIWLNTNQYATGLALEPVRRRLLGLRRHQVRAGKAAGAAALLDSRARRHPAGRAGAVSPAPAGVPDHCIRDRADLVPLPHPRRPGAAGGGRVARVGPRAGLPGAAHPPGGRVAGGALCGLAGAYISVVYTPLWVEGMVAGKGWIALALTTFATWRPARVLLGAYLFGGVTMLQFHLQGVGVECPASC